MKKLLLYNLDKILTIKYFLKLKIFRSPMGEISSIGYKIHHLNSQILFFFKNFKPKKHIKIAINFNKNGFTTFSNKKIEESSFNILNKIKSEEAQWTKDGVFKYDATNIFKNEILKIFESGLDEFIKSALNSDYCIYRHYLYRSERKSIEQIPVNSQLWHADGYPGIGMNLLISHTPLSKYNGSMKIIKWEKSLELLTKLFFEYKQFVRNEKDLGLISKDNRLEYRKVKCKILEGYIKESHAKIFQSESKKSGEIFAFKNNCVHAGGYTELGYERIVSLFHIYPSRKNKTLEEKLIFCRNNKKGGYPELKNIFNL